MLDKLPLEIQFQVFSRAPRSELKHVNSHFYAVYNELFYHKIISQFGPSIADVLIKVLPWLKKYIMSLDVFRKFSREILYKKLQLVNSSGDPLQVKFVADSWRFVHSVLQNKRLFAEYQDYKIDEPLNYVYNHYVEINRTYLLSYSRDIWLTPGFYNLSIGLVLKQGSGLGTTKFEVECGVSNYTFYPPTNIKEILPKHQFCMLKIGDFYVKHSDSNNNKLQKCRIVMEEIGLYLKSGFRIYFIDVSQPSVLFNDYELFFYAIQESNYKYFINLPLKNLYKALNFVQGTGEYGTGNPYLLEYDYEYPQEVEEEELAELKRRRSLVRESELEELKLKLHQLNEKDPTPAKHIEPQDSHDVQLMKYAKFFYNNAYKKRLKFLTVYQKRQFINRFGNFESHKDFSWLPSCSYDRDGLIWKMPLLGDL